jgi:hypothetical protein
MRGVAMKIVLRGTSISVVYTPAASVCKSPCRGSAGAKWLVLKAAESVKSFSAISDNFPVMSPAAVTGTENRSPGQDSPAGLHRRFGFAVHREAA